MFSQAIKRGDVFVLDGGFGTQLMRHFGQNVDGDPLWAARALVTNPEAVIKTHLDFLRAGADIISTNTFQASVHGFKKHLNLSEDESIELIASGVELAKKARDRFAQELPNERVPLIAGSVGPYGAFLHDGSEYTGSYIDNVSTETLKEYHKIRIETLIKAGVDILALETIPSIVEAEVLVELIKQYPIKAWVSFSCKDGTSTNYGENFQDIARRCYELNPGQIVAVGVNCTSPEYVNSLFQGINQDRINEPVPLIAYPNSGESYDPQKGWTESGKCVHLANYVPGWLDNGVKFIGGCCRVYPEDVAKISLAVMKWKSTLGLQ